MKVLKSPNNFKSAKKWNSKTVELCRQQIEDGYEVENPFFQSDPFWRDSDVVFEYTEDEIMELKKCAADVSYFANKFAFSMTDEGVQKITLRDYQEDLIKSLQIHRYSLVCASRQIGKCFLYSSKIKIKNKLTQKEEITTIGDFFYKNQKKKSLLETIKKCLWKLYSKL